MSYNIGQVFRKMRKSRGYTLKQVSEDIVSTSCLSKFEKGETDISLRSFLSLADRLNMDVGEIIFKSRESSGDFNMFLNEVSAFYIQQNAERLKEIRLEQLALFEETKSPYYKLNALILLSLLQDLDPDMPVEEADKEYIASALLNINTWSNYEIYLFGNTLNLLTFHTIELICKEINKLVSAQQASSALQKNIVNLFLNVIVIFINGDDNARAKNLIDIVKQYLGPYYFFEKTRIMFLEGVAEHKSGRENGLQLIEDSLTVMRILEPNICKNYEVFLERLHMPIT